mmetsp:Transcript_36059/g.71767  ORF Transcript_36059/g.71767 Transcript_36059/m.71767 type:complete len:206 (+) Transcript_36059:81-698(+)|eukprot:CAMPEP_0170368996 /NCGR_PEP_ID=MMETSP0117_2-20130122/7746_1 /TAXON_ID=400756 /ORGANISM="Durinskia baltica, Strain CSIRO CS-38" /LENGTH=205 /DNA_ID=CAMNT_0010623683 /DNA_START=80 /DNA_END=697 /DNA_ORIENTATION=+
MSDKEVEIVDATEEDVVLEEEKVPFTIETGDSVKVKQVLDDATIKAIIEGGGYEANFSWENTKLLLMFISCVFAMVAQFYPLPFPTSRPLLAVCCAAYFVISTVLQYFVTFVDKDTILFTKPKEGFAYEMEIRTSFPRFQEYFTLIAQFKGKPDGPKTTAKMYVGRYFTEKGEFDEDAFISDVRRHVQKFVEQKYIEIEYNHKSD